LATTIRSINRRISTAVAGRRQPENQRRRVIQNTRSKVVRNGSLTFSPKSRELQPQGGIFDGDGLVTAQQEPDESKDRQEKGWHMLRLFGPNPFQVNLLREDAIMANDRIVEYLRQSKWRVGEV
jgi:hypothetical protein